MIKHLTPKSNEEIKEGLLALELAQILHLYFKSSTVRGSKYANMMLEVMDIKYEEIKKHDKALNTKRIQLP